MQQERYRYIRNEDFTWYGLPESLLEQFYIDADDSEMVDFGEFDEKYSSYQVDFDALFFYPPLEESIVTMQDRNHRWYVLPKHLKINFFRDVYDVGGVDDQEFNRRYSKYRVDIPESPAEHQIKFN